MRAIFSKRPAARRTALAALVALALLCAGALHPSGEAFGDSVRFTSWRDTTGLIQGSGKNGRGIQSANYHATTDGLVAYCFAQGNYEPYDDVAYRCIGTASTRASVILENGWPATNVIGGVSLSDDEARQATQVALWMLGEYGYTVPYSSVRGTFDGNGVQVGKRAATAAKHLYDWSSGKSTNASYEVYNESVADIVYQVMVVAEKSEGYLELRKSSSISAATANNPAYSLAGAIYGVYSDSSCSLLVAQLTTDSSGNARSEALEAGTYYVRETSAPEGYRPDATIHTVSVPSGGETVLNVAETPIVARPSAAVFKVDGETGLDAAQGSASLAKARFSVDYYASLYDTVEEARSSGSPTRSWLLQSDEKGHVKLSPENLVSGDELFLDESGAGVLPLGTVVIRETQPPEGYLLNEEAVLRKIEHPDAATSEAVYQTPVFEDEIVRGGVSIVKSLAGGGAAELAGIEFEIVNASDAAVLVNGTAFEPGDTVATLALDTEGRAESARDLLPYGSYKIVEVAESVPAGVIPYADAQGNGSSTVATVTLEDGAAHHEQLYQTEVENFKKPALSIVKIDGDSLTAGDDEEQRLPVAGSAWLLEYDENGIWTEVERGQTDENGVLAFSDQAISRWGVYRLTETRAAREDEADGYLPREESNMPAGVTFAIDETTWEKIAAGTHEGIEGDSWTFEMRDGTPALVREEHNWLKRSIEAQKLDQDTGEAVPGTEFSLYRWIGEGRPAELDEQTRGEQHEAYEGDPRIETDASLWQLVESKIGDANGSALFEGLSFGCYLLVESRPNAEYAEWWESDLSSWDRYWFSCDEASGRHQIQVFENDKIELETTVEKTTIETTSAAFASLEGQPVDFDNVNVEEYRYDVAFSNGSTNVRADQYTVVDACEFVSRGARLTRLWTPVTENDSDGLFNLWYRSNLADAKTIYSTASATATNPDNKLADGSDRISTAGWKLWTENLSSSERTALDVADIELEDGEYITGLMLEYGSVKPGFSAKEPLIYLVNCTEHMEPSDDPEALIPNSVSSHITRNWNGGTGGTGLYDDAEDKVTTGVLGTFSFEFGRRGMAATGDAGAPLWLLALAGSAGLAAATIRLSQRRK